MKNTPSINLFFFISFVLFISLFPTTAFGYVSSNEDYSIELNEINTDVQQPTKKPQQLPGQILPTPAVSRPFSDTNYTINSTSDTYAFSISQDRIDFGALNATNPVIRTSDLILASPLQGAEILAEENRPMTATNKQFVPDTTCDNGFCTAGIPASWESALTYGFGYRCDSNTTDVCDAGFINPHAYKQFPDASASESYNQIVLSQQSKQQTKATLTYKVNISGTQPLGGYRNTITYIAVPNF